MKAKYLLLTVAWSMTSYAQSGSQSIDATAPPPAAPVQRGPADLQKLVESLALYPDPLIAVMLPAAAYPVEIVQAARFVSNTNNLAILDAQPWDDNVKAVARFPSVIERMSDELAWTVELGQAFVEQPLEVMDAIQSLRAKAQSVGTLQSTPEQVVIVTNAVVERTYETQIVFVTNTIVQIMPANPQIIYVPIYSPTIVYVPPPNYVYNPAAPLIAFGAGIAVGAILANNHCNWYYGGVYYGRGGFVVWAGRGYGRYPYYPPPPRYRPPPYYPPPGYRPPPPGYRPPGLPPPGALPPARPTPYATPWQPDQSRHRKNGSAASAGSVATTESRGWGSATTRPAIPSGPSTRPTTLPGGIGGQPAQGTVGNRPSTGTVGNRPNVGSTPYVNQPIARPSPPGNASVGAGTPRPTPSVTGRPASGRTPSSGGALSDLGSGAGAQNFSNRGTASRGNNRGSGSSRGNSR